MCLDAHAAETPVLTIFVSASFERKAKAMTLKFHFKQKVLKLFFSSDLCSIENTSASAFVCAMSEERMFL